MIAPAAMIGDVWFADASAAIVALAAKRITVVSGVNSPDARASYLIHGFGDAVSDDTPLIELSARAKRLLELAPMLPRRRTVGELELDLLAREAIYAGRPVGLHPLEFAMLWRLAEYPGQQVPRSRLVAAAWCLKQQPTSNSIAVQLSRLRAKLANAGLAELIETVDDSYRLRIATLEPARRTGRPEARPLPRRDLASMPANAA